MAYINNTDASTTTSRPLSQKEIVVIPKHIYSHLVRQNCGISNILDFSKIKDKISLMDAALWASVNDKAHVLSVPLSTSSFHDLMYRDSLDAESKDVLSTVLNICATDNTLFTNTSQQTSATDTAEFHNLQSALFIVVPRNYIHVLVSLKIERDNFIRRYVEQAYSIMHETQVHSLPLFKAYVNNFSALAD